MVFPHSKRHIVLPKFCEAVSFLLPVLIDPHESLGSLRVQVPGDLAVRIESLGIGQIIHQLREVHGHFIGVYSRILLIPEPAIPVLLYE